MQKLRGQTLHDPHHVHQCVEKLKCANLVACVYKRSVLEDPHVWKPEFNGWNLSDAENGHVHDNIEIAMKTIVIISVLFQNIMFNS